MGAPNAPVTSNERASKDRFGLWTRKRNYAARKLQLSVRKKHELHTHPPLSPWIVSCLLLHLSGQQTKDARIHCCCCRHPLCNR